MLYLHSTHAASHSLILHTLAAWYWLLKPYRPIYSPVCAQPSAVGVHWLSPNVGLKLGYWPRRHACLLACISCTCMYGALSPSPFPFPWPAFNIFCVCATLKSWGNRLDLAIGTSWIEISPTVHESRGQKGKQFSPNEKILSIQKLTEYNNYYGSLTICVAFRCSICQCRWLLYTAPVDWRCTAHPSPSTTCVGHRDYSNYCGYNNYIMGVFVCMYVCVCVCMCAWEKEKERVEK